MLFTESGMVTSVRPSQSLKAYAPISVTEKGIVTLTRSRQPLKAFSPMLVTEEGIRKALLLWAAGQRNNTVKSFE